MNPDLEEDLGRWETGAISLDELEERHPGNDARAFAELHARLRLIAREPTPDPASGWTAVERRLAERPPTVVAIGRRPRRRRSTGRRVAVLGLAAALTLGGGLAMAGGLPPPAQDAVATVVGHLGLQLPHAPEQSGNGTREHPPSTTHGAEVSDLARSTSATGCEKGQSISAAAPEQAGAHRRNHTEQADPCAKGEPGATKNPSRAGAAHPHGKGASSMAGTHVSDHAPEPSSGGHQPPGRASDRG